MATHKTVVVPTSPSFLDGQVPSWNSSTGQFDMQLPGGGLKTVSNKATLTGLPTPGLASGTLAFVTTQLAYYQLDFAAVGSLDVPPLTIDAFDDNARHWRRLPIGHSKWQFQSDWYVNGSTGDDENDGSSGAPIRSLREFNARLGGFFYTDITVNCTNLTETALELIARPMKTISGTLPTIRIKGDPGTATSGTVGSSSNSAPATNTAPTLSNSSAIGLLFKLTGGTSVGAVAWGADGAGTISEWTTPQGSPAVAPVASVSFNSYNPLSWHTFTSVHVDTGLKTHPDYDTGTELNNGFATATPRSVVVLENFVIDLSAPSFIASLGLGFFGCRMKGHLQEDGRIVFYASYFGGNQSFGIDARGRSQALLFGCLIATNTQVIVREEAHMRMRNCLMIDAIVFVQQRGYLDLFRTGLFNSSSGLVIDGDAYVRQNAGFSYEVLYGSGNTTAVTLTRGATLDLGGFVMPKITGTRELNFDLLPTAIPPIYPGATSIPTDIPMTTWLELSNAQGTLVSYYTGSRINR